MKNRKLFNKRVSKRHVNQISKNRTYENRLPIFWYILFAIGVLVAIFMFVGYCATK